MPNINAILHILTLIPNHLLQIMEKQPVTAIFNLGVEFSQNIISATSLIFRSNVLPAFVHLKHKAIRITFASFAIKNQNHYFATLRKFVATKSKRS